MILVTIKDTNMRLYYVLNELPAIMLKTIYLMSISQCIICEVITVIVRTNDDRLFVKFISVSKGRRSRKGLAFSPFRLLGRIGLQAYWVGRPSPKDPKK